ncbi:MAG: hypothetical protein HYR87_07785 [Thaumarchaeota archaeon]|nr:hypothetical protein [Nitrososphaerota archaeon]
MSINQLDLKKLEEEGIVIGHRQEIICNRCKTIFWHTYAKTCSSCESQNNGRSYKRKSKTGKLVSYYIGMFFFPLAILAIFSYGGMVIQSIIQEVLPVISLAFGFILAIWILVSQEAINSK